MAQRAASVIAKEERNIRPRTRQVSISIWRKNDEIFDDHMLLVSNTKLSHGSNQEE